LELLSSLGRRLRAASWQEREGKSDSGAPWIIAGAQHERGNWIVEDFYFEIGLVFGADVLEIREQARVITFCGDDDTSFEVALALAGGVDGGHFPQVRIFGEGLDLKGFYHAPLATGPVEQD
jgi:hypothetical protein